jgi:SAM-dependent methyltransferase
MPVDPVNAAINGAYAFCDEQQAALDEGRITEEQWYERHREFFSGIYLAADNPRGQSGHGGDEARYRYTQEMILAALDGDGSFLDVGCANGYLLEKLAEWTRDSRHTLECYGLDISPEMAALARRRLPHWADRFFVGNALHWLPDRGYRFVCVKELSYVPRGRRRQLFLHLLNRVVAPGGRLILGPWVERIGAPGIREETSAWGYPPSGGCSKPHQDQAVPVRNLYWYDTPGRLHGTLP